jgi:site-specific recombinase XerD
MSGKIVQLRAAKKYRNATSRTKGRKANDAYRVREHLTEAEMDKLLAALKRNRHGHRDWLIGLVIYRHGLRVSAASPSAGWALDVWLSGPEKPLGYMLRHSTGYALAARGMDTRRLQHFLGHASITNTVRYTAMSPEPFKDIWRRA